jgi:hypothetical protein
MSTAFQEKAAFLRESSGSTSIQTTLLKVLKVLKLFGIPHYVCGGYAVQEHGYPRFTVDVDIIVPDVGLAIEKLSLNGFRTNPGSTMTVTDRETKVEVDLLPGGRKVDSGPLTLPMPTTVSDEPQLLTLAALISAKLSTWLARGIVRLRDQSDVVELIQANHLPRDFPVAPEVSAEYQRIWDELHK